MGGSCSSSDESYHKQSPSQLRVCYHSALSAYRIQQHQLNGTKDLTRWHKTLRKILGSVDSKIAHWERFRHMFLSFLDSGHEDLQVGWIANAQHMSLDYSSYASQFQAQNFFARSSMSYSREEFEKWDLAQQVQQNQILQTEPCEEEEKQSKASVISRPARHQLMKRKQLFLNVMMNLSPVKELRQNLSEQLGTSNHIVKKMVEQFHKTFQEIFEGELKREELGYSPNDEETYKNICGLIKCFVRVIKKFVIWAYQKVILQFTKVLKERDFEPDYIVESVVYELLFQQSQSTMNKILKKLIKKKHAEEIKKFQRIIEKTKTQKLGDYDNYLRSSAVFLMEVTRDPYEEVTRKIARLQSQSSPYTKFEEILSLEEEMMKCLMNYHRNSTNIKVKVRKNFGMDIKAPILTYCLIKSNNSELLVDKTLVEEFVNKNYQDDTPRFSAFVGCLDAIISEQSLFSNASRDIGQEDFNNKKLLSEEGKIVAMHF